MKELEYLSENLCAGCLDICLEVSEGISNSEHFLWVKKLRKVEVLCRFGIAEKCHGLCSLRPKNMDISNKIKVKLA